MMLQAWCTIILTNPVFIPSVTRGLYSPALSAKPGHVFFLYVFTWNPFRYLRIGHPCRIDDNIIQRISIFNRLSFDGTLCFPPGKTPFQSFSRPDAATASRADQCGPRAQIAAPMTNGVCKRGRVSLTDLRASDIVLYLFCFFFSAHTTDRAKRSPSPGVSKRFRRYRVSLSLFIII